jgi:hypothetical protein
VVSGEPLVLLEDWRIVAMHLKVRDDVTSVLAQHLVHILNETGFWWRRHDEYASQ